MGFTSLQLAWDSVIFLPEKTFKEWLYQSLNYQMPYRVTRNLQRVFIQLLHVLSFSVLEGCHNTRVSSDTRLSQFKSGTLALQWTSISAGWGRSTSYIFPALWIPSHRSNPAVPGELSHFYLNCFGSCCFTERTVWFYSCVNIYTCTFVYVFCAYCRSSFFLVLAFIALVLMVLCVCVFPFPSQESAAWMRWLHHYLDN